VGTILAQRGGSKLPQAKSVLPVVLKSIVMFRGNQMLAVMRKKKDQMVFFLIFVGFCLQ
jgi:hypothetical protein